MTAAARTAETLYIVINRDGRAYRVLEDGSGGDGGDDDFDFSWGPD